MSQPQGNFSNIARCVQSVHRAGVPQGLLILLMNSTKLRFAIGVIRSMA